MLNEWDDKCAHGCMLLAIMVLCGKVKHVYNTLLTFGLFVNILTLGYKYAKYERVLHCFVN